MRSRAFLRDGWVAMALCLSLVPLGQAQELVSVRSAGVNLRSAPGTEANVLWKLGQGYPLQVLEHRGDWLKVQDFEGDQGWVARSVTQAHRHHIVKVASAHLRSGPGAQHRSLGQVRYGDVLRTVRRQGDWVVVQHPQTQAMAWIASALVWGW